MRSLSPVRHMSALLKSNLTRNFNVLRSKVAGSLNALQTPSPIKTDHFKTLNSTDSGVKQQSINHLDD